MSSLSGSDTETDDDLSLESHKAEMLASGFAYNDDEDKEYEKRYGRCHPKIFLINQDGLVLSVFQTVVYSTKVQFIYGLCPYMDISVQILF